MKIAFATNDRKTLANRTGRANEFVIYEISDTDIINTTYIKNTHEHHEHGEHGHSHDDIIEKLDGVDFLFVKKVGVHMKENLVDAGIKYEISKDESIEDIISRFFSEDDE